MTEVKIELLLFREVKRLKECALALSEYYEDES